MIKGGKLMLGCAVGAVTIVVGFTTIFTVFVEIARHQMLFGKNKVEEWMLGTPQPVSGRETSDNGFVNAGVGVGWNDFVHPDDPSEPWGIPFAQKEKLGCEFQDCPNYCNHTGVDFPGDIGTPIYATMAGLVVFARSNGPWGNLIVVENNGYQTYYAHLDSFSVSKGEVISQGQVIGARGHNGNSSGPHLHYGIKKRTGEDSYTWVDPEMFFNRSDTIEWPCGK